jgi:RNA polymerase sigma factor (sigma-70 family)
VDRKQLLSDYYQLEKESLTKKISRKMFDLQDTEDVLHDAFEKALRYLDTYDGTQGFAAWFGVILNNCVKDYRTEFLNNKIGMSHKDVEEIGDDQFAIEDSGIETDWKAIDIVGKEIDSKTEPAKKILGLYFLYQMPSAEIRYFLEDIKLKAIRMCIHRFKSDMREKYSGTS